MARGRVKLPILTNGRHPAAFHPLPPPLPPAPCPGSMAVGYAPDGLSLATVRYVTHGGGGPTTPGIVVVAAYDPAVMSAILQELDLSQGPKGPLVGSKAWVWFRFFCPHFTIFISHRISHRGTLDPTSCPGQG